eukprot:768478-Hanusia_phi.AAC.13
MKFCEAAASTRAQATRLCDHRSADVGGSEDLELRLRRETSSHHITAANFHASGIPIEKKATIAPTIVPKLATPKAFNMLFEDLMVARMFSLSRPSIIWHIARGINCAQTTVYAGCVVEEESKPTLDMSIDVKKVTMAPDTMLPIFVFFSAHKPKALDPMRRATDCLISILAI